VSADHNGPDELTESNAAHFAGFCRSPTTVYVDYPFQDPDVIGDPAREPDPR